MIKRHHTTFAATALALATSAFAAPKVLVVSSTETGATHNSIQAAVNACSPTDTCTIKLVDPTYTLERPIWLVNKANITIEGATKSGEKPKLAYAEALTAHVVNPLSGSHVQPKVRKVFTLPYLVEADGRPCEGAAANCLVDPKRPQGWNMWPHKARTMKDLPVDDQGDKSDTSSAYSKIGFQLNGMLVVEHSQDIAIRGIVLDGVRPMYYENTEIWSLMYSVFSGTTGLNVFQSLRVTLQDCDVKSFFSAIRILGDTAKKIRPVASRPSSTGGHIFERNRIHDNWWAFYDEMERDLPSVIRYNVAWNNINKAIQYPDSLREAIVKSEEMATHTGGFMFTFDTMFAVHKIHNNTLHKHGVVLGFSGFGRMEFSHLFYNNVLTGPVDSIRSGTDIIRYGQDWHQLLQYGSSTIHNNTFELEGGVKFMTQVRNEAKIVSDTLPDPNVEGAFCAKGCWIRFDPISVILATQPPFLWNGWDIQHGGSYQAYYTDKSNKRWGPFTISDPNMIDSTGLITRMGGSTGTPVDWKANQNMYTFRLPLQSRDPAVAGYLVPDWNAKEVTKTVRHNGWLLDPANAAVDRGAFCWDDAKQQTLLGECTSITASIDYPSTLSAPRTNRPGLHSALGKWDPKGRPSARFMKLPR
jgi:hypothetical protein